MSPKNLRKLVPLIIALIEMHRWRLVPTVSFRREGGLLPDAFELDCPRVLLHASTQILTLFCGDQIP